MRKDVIRVTKRFSFDMAHALYRHDGACASIHGHTYSLEITVSGPVMNIPENPKDGMVIDFAELKSLVVSKVVSVYDHALLLNAAGPALAYPATPDAKIIYTPWQPTCENLLLHITGQLMEALPSQVQLQRVYLQETPASYAEWLRADNL